MGDSSDARGRDSGIARRAVHYAQPRAEGEPMTHVRITHIGGPTTLIEFAGWRILTDPTFDPAGRRYFFGWGTTSKKTAGPSMAPEELGDIDAVLVSHHHHGDNLDPTGRALLPGWGITITTAKAAEHLGGDSVGLKPWS